MHSIDTLHVRTPSPTPLLLRARLIHCSTLWKLIILVSRTNSHTPATSVSPGEGLRQHATKDTPTSTPRLIFLSLTHTLLLLPTSRTGCTCNSTCPYANITNRTCDAMMLPNATLRNGTFGCCDTSSPKCCVDGQSTCSGWEYTNCTNSTGPNLTTTAKPLGFTYSLVRDLRDFDDSMWHRPSNSSNHTNHTCTNHTTCAMFMQHNTSKCCNTTCNMTADKTCNIRWGVACVAPLPLFLLLMTMTMMLCIPLYWCTCARACAHVLERRLPELPCIISSTRSSPGTLHFAHPLGPPLTTHPHPHTYTHVLAFVCQCVVTPTRSP
jgi:hypothetical protein